MSATTGFIEHDGARLHWDSAGTGPSLVLLHAGIADRRMWDPQVAAFGGTHRVIRYDLRGFGETAVPAAAFAHTDDLRAVLRALDAAPAVLVGCSFGARVAIDAVLETPEIARALVLIAPALSGWAFGAALDAVDAEIEAAFEAGDLDRAAELDLRAWVDGPRRDPDEVDAAFRERARVLARGVYDVPHSEGAHHRERPAPAIGRLAELRLPTLVVRGLLDQPDILAICDLLVGRLPDARLVDIPDSAHLPSLERPEPVNAAIRAFLAEVRT